MMVFLTTCALFLAAASSCSMLTIFVELLRLLLFEEEALDSNWAMSRLPELLLLLASDLALCLVFCCDGADGDVDAPSCVSSGITGDAFFCSCLATLC